MTECYRVCDTRYPFLWADDSQPPGRWHGPGEGPCHYLSTTPKGAWAEVLRHEGIRDAADVAGIEAASWETEVAAPAVAPVLDPAVLIGDESSYPTCRREARRIRAGGHDSLRAPSAALLSGRAETYGVVGGGQIVAGSVGSETFVFFGPTGGISAMPLAEGRPDPDVLADVRHL